MIQKKLVKSLMTCYAAGSVGAMVNSLAMYIALLIGIESMFGVSIMSGWTLDWLYPRLVWGGVLAFIFVLPFYRSRILVRGLVWSIIPTIPNLFIIFPGQADLVTGGPGIKVGVITLVCMYIFNAFWGVTTAYLLTLFDE